MGYVSRSTVASATNGLNVNEFVSLDDAKAKNEAWRRDYNEH